MRRRCGSESTLPLLALPLPFCQRQMPLLVFSPPFCQRLMPLLAVLQQQQGATACYIHVGGGAAPLVHELTLPDWAVRHCLSLTLHCLVHFFPLPFLDLPLSFHCL